MPDPALPVPLPEPTEDTGTPLFRRSYVDALGRPLTGRLQLTPLEPLDGDQMMLAVPVGVQIINGVAEANLPPGSYRLTGILRTVDRTAVVVNQQIVLSRRYPD